MAAFSDSEQTLLASVTNQDLRDSLALIRRAMEKIWAGDMPRIIQDYTDHGVHHCERLAGAVMQLLDANGGRPISPREMYLLLSSIYIHDIGMQCDVVRFPAIKQRAERLGAKFDIPITARSSNDYTKDEQAAIRKNHQYLSLGWLDYAFETGETVLGPAAKTIPGDLVDDLMDVCKHHTKVPISNCPVALQFYPNERKQIVAALLRFADELDIDQNRVSSPDIVKNFAIDPRNSVYWWLHHRTNITFSNRNVVTLTIRLHPDDAAQFGAFVNDAFIVEFRSKNLQVLSVLAQNGIPIVISDDSKVVEHKRAERLPQEAVEALQAMQKRDDPLLDLAEEVRTWLRAIRYEVSDPKQSSPRTVDMIATLDQGTVRQRVLVRCVGGEIAATDVERLDEDLDRKTPQGWLISDKRVSPRAIEKAAEDEAFSVFTLADFLRQKIWLSYFNALTALVEEPRIPELYVDLACYKQDMDGRGNEKGRDRYASLDRYIDTWLTERGKVHISILGEFGTGKTWFCRHYAYRQLQRYLKDPAGERMPLLITLRAFAKAMTAQQLINDALLEQYKLPFVGGAFEVFQEMNRRGKLLLILDGFDEMARQVDYQTVVDNFWELAKLVEDGSKVILTSRTEYFRWDEESEKVLSGQEFGRRTIVLQPPRFEVLYLEPFTDKQIRSVIVGRKGAEEGPTIADRILSNQNLAEMARKPVLIELLLAALDEVSADVLENRSEVYLYATDKLLLRNITAEKTFTSTADKLYFLCELAWEMIKSGELRIHYTVIPERIKTYFGDKIKDQHELDTWDFDLRNQTLLHRDAAGYYEFAHKSLAEYFVAFKFAAELGCLAPKFAQTYTEASGKLCEIPIKQKDILGLAETFGVMKLTDERISAIRRLLQGIINNSNLYHLWDLISATTMSTPGLIKFTGGNCITLLRDQKCSFQNTALSKAILSGADISDLNLMNSDLSHATLEEITINYSTNLQGANLSHAKIGIDNYGIPLYCINVISPNGSMLSIGTENQVRVIDLENKNIIFESINLLESGIFPSFSPNNNLIAGGSISWIKIWNIATGEEKINIKLENTEGVIIIPVFSPDGKRIAARGKSWLKTWDIDTGVELISIKLPYNIDWNSITQYILLPSFSSDGEKISASGNNWVKIWNSYDGSDLTTIHVGSAKKSIICSSFSPDGKYIIGNSRRWIKVWALETCSEILEIKLSSREDFDIHPLITPDGKSFVSINFDHLGMWDIYTGENNLDIQCDWLYPMNMINTDDKGNLVTGIFDDGISRIWELSTGNLAYSINVSTNCLSTSITGMSGLEQEVIWLSPDSDQSNSLLEFFADRGAILDEEQQHTLAELRRKREEEQRQAAEEAAAAERPKRPRARRKKDAE